jgi:hypothetical protein
MHPTMSLKAAENKKKTDIRARLGKQNSSNDGPKTDKEHLSSL